MGRSAPGELEALHSRGGGRVWLGEELLTEIGRSYNVSAATISRLTA
jgi:hypothetical protein